MCACMCVCQTSIITSGIGTTVALHAPRRPVCKSFDRYPAGRSVRRQRWRLRLRDLALFGIDAVRLVFFLVVLCLVYGNVHTHCTVTQANTHENTHMTTGSKVYRKMLQKPLRIRCFVCFTFIHTYMHAPTRTNACRPTCIPTKMNANKIIYMHIYTRTNMHAYICKHWARSGDGALAPSCRAPHGHDQTREIFRYF